MTMTLAFVPEHSYRAEKERERAHRRDSANGRAKTTVARAAVADPLSRPSRNEATHPAIAASLTLHFTVAAVAFFLRAGDPRPTHPYDVPVRVEVVDPPKREIPTPIPTPAPAVLPPSTERPVLKPVSVADPIPPDPINVEDPTRMESPKEPARRVVGIDMESTTVAGAGPAFGVGNTRMGQTAEVAKDPTLVEPLAATFSPPKRLYAPPPEYPSVLRAEGIEGDVGLRVVIDASGRVDRVAVTEPSEHEEFNRAAVAAANASTYEAARSNGVAITRAIEFTVRFRLRE